MNHPNMNYLMWYDDSKGAIQDKLAAGMACFEETFHAVPNTLLAHTSAGALVVPPGCTLELVPNVQPNVFWIGCHGLKIGEVRS